MKFQRGQNAQQHVPVHRYDNDKMITAHSLIVFPTLISLICVDCLVLSSRPKMEIATKEEGNPIKQDVKKGQQREDSIWSCELRYWRCIAYLTHLLTCIFLLLD